MMAMAGPPGSCSFLPLLEPLEDSTAGHAEQIDAYLTIAKYVPTVTPEGCRVNYNPCHFCACLLLPNVAEK